MVMIKTTSIGTMRAPKNLQDVLSGNNGQKTMVEYALEALEVGAVFPCNGKIPAIPSKKGGHGCLDATRIQIRVRDFWADYPDANPAISTDGLITLDFDTKENAFPANKEAWQVKYGLLPKTRVHLTGGGGEHWIYKAPAGLKISGGDNCYGILHVDMRAWHQYTMAPGSIHPFTGRRYEVIDDSPITDAPDYLVEVLKSGTKSKMTAQIGNTPLDNRIPRGQQDDWLISQAGVYRRRGDAEDIIFQKLKIDALRLDQDPERRPYTDDDFHRIAQSAGRYEPQPGQANNPDYTFTDRGNGARFGDMFRGRVFYCPERKMWAVYNGKYWGWDTGAIQVMHLAKNVPKAIYQEAASEPHDGPRKALVDHARRTENDQRLKALLSQAQSESGLAVSIDQLDRNEWLINAGNGTVDLRTGELKLHEPADLITAYTPVEYHAEAKNELWDYTVNSIFEGRESVRDYVQRGLGYSLTGNQDEQVVFFPHGQGGEGKTTLLGSVADTLGPDYATEIEPQTFMVSKTQGTSGPNEGIAKLYRKRLALSTEVEDGQRLSVSLIKRMTGGEKLHHERKFEHGFEYAPTHKLWLSGNHKPVITDTTLSIWRRVKFINFTATITEAKRIKDLRAQLKAKEHQEAILAWLVKGCLDWQKNGLGEPPEVTTATEGYREEMDLLADFLAERCVIQPSATITVSEIYKVYKEWTDQNDAALLGKIKFGARLTEKGISKARGTGNKPIWRGIRLLEDGEEPQEVTNYAQKVTSVTEISYKAPISLFSLENREKQLMEVTKVTEVPGPTTHPEYMCSVCGGHKAWRGQWGPVCATCHPQPESAIRDASTMTR